MPAPNLTRFKIKVGVRGTFPMLMNPMTEEMLLKLHERQTGGNDTSKMAPAKVAEKKVIRSEDGRIAIPTQYLLSCLVESGRDVPFKARRKVSTAETTELFSFLALDAGEFIPLTDGATDAEPQWVMDGRMGRNKNAGRGKGVPVYTIRPKLPKWGFEVIVDLKGWIAPPAVVRSLFIRAGQVGIGDFRPSCRGPFGQFELVGFEIVGKQQMHEEDVFLDMDDENGAGNGDGSGTSEREEEVVGAGAAVA